MAKLVQEDFLKYAFSIGQQIASDPKLLEKQAGIWGGIASLLGRGASAAAKAKPSLWQHAKSLSGFAAHQPKTIGSRLSYPFRKVLGNAGGTEAFGFGMLGGGAGALTADEGERLKGFGKGFGLGAIGGAGWNVGNRAFGSVAKRVGNASGKGFRGALGTVADPKKGLNEFGKIWNSGLSTGRKAGLLGTKALVSGGGLAAGMGMNVAAEEQAQKYIPSLRSEVPKHIRNAAKIPAAMSSVVRRSPLGLTPGASSGATSGTTPGAM